MTPPHPATRYTRGQRGNYCRRTHIAIFAALAAILAAITIAPTPAAAEDTTALQLSNTGATDTWGTKLTAPILDSDSPTVVWGGYLDGTFYARNNTSATTTFSGNISGSVTEEVSPGKWVTSTDVSPFRVEFYYATVNPPLGSGGTTLGKVTVAPYQPVGLTLRISLIGKPRPFTGSLSLTIVLLISADEAPVEFRTGPISGGIPGSSAAAPPSTLSSLPPSRTPANPAVTPGGAGPRTIAAGTSAGNPAGVPSHGGNGGNTGTPGGLSYTGIPAFNLLAWAALLIGVGVFILRSRLARRARPAGAPGRRARRGRLP